MPLPAIGVKTALEVFDIQRQLFLELRPDASDYQGGHEPQEGYAEPVKT